jgi:hypothetical protein
MERKKYIGTRESLDGTGTKTSQESSTAMTQLKQLSFSLSLQYWCQDFKTHEKFILFHLSHFSNPDYVRTEHFNLKDHHCY